MIDVLVERGEDEFLAVDSSSSDLVKPFEPNLSRRLGIALDFGHPAIVFWGRTSATFPPSSAIASV